MKYIFVVGAPGSKWSSTVLNTYWSPSIDQTDYSEDRTYYHDATGEMMLMHIGAYFDPGMEFGDFFDEIEDYTKEQCEAEFDRPFSGNGIRIIKSHVLSNKIDLLRERWPDCPIVTVHRPNDACLGWWVSAENFILHTLHTTTTTKTCPGWLRLLPRKMKAFVRHCTSIQVYM